MLRSGKAIATRCASSPTCGSAGRGGPQSAEQGLALLRGAAAAGRMPRGAFLYEQLGGIFQALNSTSFNCNAATAALKTQMWGNAVADFDGVTANPLPGTSEPAYPILGAGAICNQSAYC